MLVHRAASAQRAFPRCAFLVAVASLAATACTPVARAEPPDAEPAHIVAPLESSPPKPTGGWARYAYDVVRVLPHDPAAFTQGLTVHGGAFYESTGLYGQSSVRLLDLLSGAVRKRASAPAEVFGEGLTVLGDRVYQLTWREHVCIVYTLDFEPVGRFAYAGEGWGLAQDGAHLIVSDGSSDLRVVDPSSFQTVRTLHVHGPSGPVRNLNELEVVRGALLANVWGSDRILQIDLHTGDVTGVVDLAGLYPERDRTDPDAVLNGIAYDEAADRLFVTGKRWPRIFEIRLRRLPE